MNPHLTELSAVISTMINSPVFAAAFESANAIIAESLPVRHKILIAGNGGSAGEAQHFAAIFTSHFKKERKAYPVIALTTDSSALTAIGNDYGMEQIFSRQVQALGTTGDVLIAMSVSGNSKNIIAAIAEAKTLGMKVIALIGKDGGVMKGMADVEFIIPSNDSSRVQEMHLVVLHALAAETEAYLN